MPQILAPGGSKEAVIAAIQNGADGFYMGGSGWTRWGRVTELADEEAACCIALGRQHGKEIQVVFNRVPTHADTSEFLKTMEDFYHRGADQFILNDLGMISLARRHFPKARLGASIGCSIKNLEEARFYTELGVSTLVLPWTMGAAEIRELKRQAPDLRIEVFLYVKAPHVVLGNCWLGSYVHQRKMTTPAGASRFSGSAKRGGNCSKPCQSSWKLITDGKTLAFAPLPVRHLIMASSLRELIPVGVDILKIQGRDLPPEKVGEIVRVLKDLVTNTSNTYDCAANVKELKTLLPDPKLV